MLGVLLTLLFCAGAAGLGSTLLAKWFPELDPAFCWGAGGSFTLAAIATLGLFIGLVPGGLSWGVFLVAAIALAGFCFAFQNRASLKLKKPEGWEWLFVGIFAVGALIALIAVLAPSDSLDWDTLAYHLAVPKIWLLNGHIIPIQTIHHSNFPLDVDMLYVWGLSWGGEAGAKAFSFAATVFASLALFGLARERYGKFAGWWTALAFATMPVVLWESGSAYIDVANGAYVALGILLAARWAMQLEERRWLWLAALALGFAAGSKYNGLQTIFAVFLALVVVLAVTKKLAANLRWGLAAAALALAVCCPWYIKNLLWTGNPVYPFFYEHFDGRNWSQFNADIYRDEQENFGVGRTPRGRDFRAIGEAVLGLAVMPGRFTNPDEAHGQGFPFQSLGFAVIAAGLFWCFLGKFEPYEVVIFLAIGVSMLMWFELSQQTRYLVGLAAPLCVLLGAASVRLKAGKVLAAAAVLQAAYTIGMLKVIFTDRQLQVDTGKVSSEQFQTAGNAFYPASQQINLTCTDGTVALYDEVFGYLLDVPYIWANPGHSTLIDYPNISTGDGLTKALKALGVKYVYLSLIRMDPQQRDRMLQAMGSTGPPVPYTDQEKAEAFKDLRNKWRILIAEAVDANDLRPVGVFHSGVLFVIP